MFLSSFCIRKTPYLLTVASLTIIILASNLPVTRVSAQPPPTWYNPSWTKARPITIDNTLNPTALSSFQLKIDLNYDSDMKTDFSDLRFTESDGVTVIPHWIGTSTASVSAAVFVKVPTIPASGTTTIYMYYGNPSATTTSNGTTTFEFFDDFETAYAIPWTPKQPLPSPKADLSCAYMHAGHPPRLGCMLRRLLGVQTI